MRLHKPGGAFVPKLKRTKIASLEKIRVAMLWSACFGKDYLKPSTVEPLLCPFVKRFIRHLI